jgi:predicted deacetylase
MPAEAPKVCISVHDVAPGTWPACRRLLRMIDSFGRVPVTLLVVPDYHRQGRIDRFPVFMREVEQRLARGDEVALHGYYHLDEGPRPAGPVDWFRRRVLTRGEGEFAVLPFEPARKRLQLGMSVMNSLGWPVHGFVSPAWLLGAEARAALGRFKIAYTTTRGGIYRLPGWRFTRSPSLVYSVGAAWRHWMSESLNRAVLPLARRGELLRLSLHPVDASLPQAVSHWRSVIGEVLRTHEAVTKARWAAARLAGPDAGSALAA